MALTIITMNMMLIGGAPFQRKPYGHNQWYHDCTRFANNSTVTLNQCRETVPQLPKPTLIKSSNQKASARGAPRSIPTHGLRRRHCFRRQAGDVCCVHQHVAEEMLSLMRRNSYKKVEGQYRRMTIATPSILALQAS
jgi:hypothetical protein